MNISILNQESQSSFCLVIGLSHKVKNFDLLQIIVKQNEKILSHKIENFEKILNEHALSSRWIVKIDLPENDNSNIEITI